MGTYVYIGNCKSCEISFTIGVEGAEDRFLTVACPQCARFWHYDNVIDMDDWKTQGRELINSGRVSAAIAHCRRLTGCSLREAAKRVHALPEYKKFTEHARRNPGP